MASSSTVMMIKLVGVGDEGVGKASMVASYLGDPTLTCFSGYSVNVMVDYRMVSLGLWVPYGRENTDRMRSLCYPQTDVFLLCFSVVCPSSFENIKNKWWPEVTSHCQCSRIVVVGTKVDLRDDKEAVARLRAAGQAPITSEQGRQLVEQIHAHAYVECSAVTNTGVQNVFSEAIKVTLPPICKQHRDPCLLS
ncbi:Rho GTPase [Pelomyxa schiedti]|nr:Rho GTPase [Pelomyxa schiedti]